jgi:hypothetical protein
MSSSRQNRQSVVTSDGSVNGMMEKVKNDVFTRVIVAATESGDYEKDVCGRPT